MSHVCISCFPGVPSVLGAEKDIDSVFLWFSKSYQYEVNKASQKIPVFVCLHMGCVCIQKAHHCTLGKLWSGIGNGNLANLSEKCHFYFLMGFAQISSVKVRKIGKNVHLLDSNAFFCYMLVFVKNLCFARIVFVFDTKLLHWPVFTFGLFLQLNEGRKHWKGYQMTSGMYFISSKYIWNIPIVHWRKEVLKGLPDDLWYVRSSRYFPALAPSSPALCWRVRKNTTCHFFRNYFNMRQEI